MNIYQEIKMIDWLIDWLIEWLKERDTGSVVVQMNEDVKDISLDVIWSVVAYNRSSDFEL